jgi:hypothetical protein
VRNAGKGLRDDLVDHGRVAKSEEVHGDLDVTQLRTSSNDAGSPSGDQSHAERDVATVVFVLKGVFGAFALGNGEGETLTGRLGTATGFARDRHCAKQPGLRWSRVLCRVRLHGRADHSGLRYWRKGGLRHATSLLR